MTRVVVSSLYSIKIKDSTDRGKPNTPCTEHGGSEQHVFTVGSDGRSLLWKAGNKHNFIFKLIIIIIIFKLIHHDYMMMLCI